MIGYSAIIFDLLHNAQCYADEKFCALLCTNLWLDYSITEALIKYCFKIFAIMLALCLMLTETYYAQNNYAGIIGLGL